MHKAFPCDVATWIRSRVCWNLACRLHCSNDTLQDLKNLQKGRDFCLSDEWTFIEWLLFISWRKIALQCCVGFCPTTTWISHNYTYIPSVFSLRPLHSSHASRSSQNSRLGSLRYTATSHQLSILHLIVYICWCHFLTPPPHVYKSIPCIGVSIPSLQIGSSISFF